MKPGIGGARIGVGLWFTLLAHLIHDGTDLGLWVSAKPLLFESLFGLLLASER
jgi:hypothetical protein